MQSAREAQGFEVRLQERYAARTSSSKISILAALMNKRYQTGTDVSDDKSGLESDISGLDTIDYALAEEL